MKSDTQLKLDVIEELQWEPTVTSSDINVAAKDGVVMLSGTVPHYAEKFAAERATQRVEGVKAIAEEMEVHLAGIHKRNDTEIAESVVEFSQVACLGAQQHPGDHRKGLGDTHGKRQVGITIAMAPDVAEATLIPRAPKGREDTVAQIDRLLQAHEIVLLEARAMARDSAARGDLGTNDIIVSDVIRGNELQAWFLAEHLQ